MEQLILTVASLITACGVIIKAVDKIFDKKLKPIDDQIQKLDESQCKNYLVRFLADVENGEDIDEVEKERAYEVYDHYTNDLHKNSYIHAKWERLMK